MTGPSFPFFQPNVTPSYTFQNPGDVGQIGGELHGLAKAFGEMQEREQVAQQQAQEHEMSMQALSLRQLQAQEALERAKIDKVRATTEKQKAQAEADEKVAKREQEALERKQKARAGDAAGEAVVQKGLQGAGDASQAEANPFFDLIAGILPSLYGATAAADPQGQEITDFLGSEAAKKMMTPPTPRDQVGFGNDWTYSQETGQPIAPIGIQGKKGGGGTEGPDDGPRLLAGQDKRMGDDLKAAKQVQQNMGGIIGSSRLSSDAKTGALAPYLQSYGKMLVAMGVATPDQIKDVKKREEFMQLSVRNSLAILASGAYGTGNSITEQDRRAAEKLSGADLKLEPSTIKLTMRINILAQAQQLEQYLRKLDALKANPPKGYTAADIDAQYGSDVGGSVGLQKSIDMLRKEANRVMSLEEVEKLANARPGSIGDRAAQLRGAR